jgi:peptide/nickel transport system ATP-binding protein
VLYAGRMVETGATAAVLNTARHPYTKGLLAALPRPDLARLSSIPGSLPDMLVADTGCNFRPRCAFAAAGCERKQTLQGAFHRASCWRAAALLHAPWPSDPSPPAPSPRPTTPLMQASNLTRRFTAGGGLSRLFGRSGGEVLAVDNLSLAINVGEIVGLVGESGCGKSTLGRLLLRLLPADGGSLAFSGAPVATSPDAAFRRAAQIVFQNPDTSLNPRQTIGTILRRPLHRFGLAHGAAATREVARLLGLVRLPNGYAQRYPHQLSGGEKQRIGIARALASRPRFLVCDEAVAALDVSVQAAILNLLRDLRDELGVAYLFISHDIGVIAHIADRVAVMYRGSLVEEGAVDDVLRPPYHPYTELLLRSVPIIGTIRQPPPPAETSAATAIPACKFAARCPRRLGPICDSVAPPWQSVERGHQIRCHIPLPVLATIPPWLPIHRLELSTSAQATYST